jgi:hypothetical protein
VQLASSTEAPDDLLHSGDQDLSSLTGDSAHSHNANNFKGDKNMDEPAFLETQEPSTDLPPHVSTTNAWQLFGLREGESVIEAIARSKVGSNTQDHSSRTDE